MSVMNMLIWVSKTYMFVDTHAGENTARFVERRKVGNTSQRSRVWCNQPNINMCPHVFGTSNRSLDGYVLLASMLQNWFGRAVCFSGVRSHPRRAVQDNGEGAGRERGPVKGRYARPGLQLCVCPACSIAD